MKVVWAVLCQSSVIDRATNNVSLFNVVEEIDLVGPLPLPSSGEVIAPFVFDLVILFARSDVDTPEKGRGRIRVVRLDETRSAPQEFEIDLTKFLRFRVVAKIPGLPLTGAGIYRFLVDCSVDSSEGSIPFELPIRVTMSIPEA